MEARETETLMREIQELAAQSREGREAVIARSREIRELIALLLMAED